MPKDVVTVRDMDGNESEAFINELSWRPACYGIVIKDDAVLLLKQYNGYDLPGGGVNLGEQLESAVIREVKEEAGITVVNPKIVHAATSFFKRSYAEGNVVQSVSLYYVCDYESGEISVEGLDEHEQQYSEGCVWFPLADLDAIEVAASFDWRELIKAQI